jgi:hypothetical protein
MKEYFPHQFFQAEYSKMLDDAFRQERIHPANVGELEIVKGFFDYLETVAIPLMLGDDWIFEAVRQFASEYVTDCFDAWERTGALATKAHKEKDALDKEVGDFVKVAVRYHAMDKPKDGQLFLHKASDFYEKLRLSFLPAKERGRAKALYHKALDFERRYLKVILQNTRELYERVLPRVMVTMRCVVRVEKSLPKKPNKLLGISGSLSWYRDHIDQAHPLYPVTGWLSSYYKKARNVASHVKGMQWDPSSNLVTLPDNSGAIEVDDREFTQRYRYFVNICEMGMNAILAAYSKRCKDELSVKLAEDCIEMIRRIDPDDPTYGARSISIRSYT